jgi:hypothetical protein
MDYLSGVQEYIDIESIINPGRAGNKPCGNKALVMKRGIWRQQVSEPGGRLRPMQSKVLIVRYGYAYDNGYPVNGDFYYCICLARIGNRLRQTASAPYASMKTALRQAEYDFVGIMWESTLDAADGAVDPVSLGS